MARRRYELTDREWAILSPLLPNKPRGVPRVDDRRVLNGILWRFRTGSPWAEIRERYGPPAVGLLEMKGHRGCVGRYRRCSQCLLTEGWLHRWNVH